MRVKSLLIFFLVIMGFSACKKNDLTSCINAVDCPEGYECSADGVCVEVANDDVSSKSDNEISDINNKNDNVQQSDSNDSAGDSDDSFPDDSADSEGENSDSDSIESDESGDDVINDDDICVVPGCDVICGGIIDNGCGIKTDCRCEPVHHFASLADSDSVKDSDSLYFLSGTGDTNSLKIYSSTDLIEFVEYFAYNPSALVDAAYSYCCIWAPEIYKTPGGVYNIYFSAKRVASGAECSCPDVSDVTTFYAVFDEVAENFGHPQLVDFGDDKPQSRVGSGCSIYGCEKTIRIDSALFNDNGSEWFFYNWFEDGNNVSSIKMDNPSEILTNLESGALEGNVNEGTDVFKRNGKYYLFYSLNSFDADYSMKYIMADTVAELVRARIPRWFSTPVKNSSDLLVATHGHSSVVERYGEYYIFYHQGIFTVPGTFSGRDTFKSRLHFRDDGSIQMLNKIDIGWSNAGEGYLYSIDVKPKNGNWVSPCISGTTIGTYKKYSFIGNCPDFSNKLVHKAEIEKIRLNYSNNGTWGEPNVVEIDYDGVTSDISIKIPDKNFDHLKIRFAQQKTADIYRLDLKPKSGNWLAPCVGSVSFQKPLSLGGDFAYTFNGSCLTAPNNGTSVPIENIEKVRICSDENEDWESPVCVEKDYDGTTRYIEVW